MPSAMLTTQNSTTPDAEVANLSTRFLLALWESDDPAVPKGKLTKRLKRKSEKPEDFKLLFDDAIAQLQEKGAIKTEGTKSAPKFALTDKGIKLLGQYLQGADLAIEGTIVGAWIAKALCKWIQQSVITANIATTNGKVADGAIASEEMALQPVASITSYEEFKPVALEVFDHLNSDYNYDNLVPIYRIRREIGDRVSRSDFNSWLLKMQSDDVLLLQGGSVEDSAADKIEDSVRTEISGLRCYAKRLD